MTGEGTPLFGVHVSIEIGSFVQILTTDHPRDSVLRRQDYKSDIPIRIGENVWIGSDAIILPGVSIGSRRRHCRGGELGTAEFSTGATVMGNPARVSGREK